MHSIYFISLVSGKKMLIIRPVLFQYPPECLLLSNYTKKSDMGKNTNFKK